MKKIAIAVCLLFTIALIEETNQKRSICLRKSRCLFKGEYKISFVSFLDFYTFPKKYRNY